MSSAKLFSWTRPSSAVLHAGVPKYGHPAHRKASPRAQLPQPPPPTLEAAPAGSLPSAISLASTSARPQTQFLQARPRVEQSATVACFGARSASDSRLSASINFRVRRLNCWTVGSAVDIRNGNRKRQSNGNRNSDTPTHRNWRFSPKYTQLEKVRRVVF
jgi:hypothetical protein